MNAVIDIGTNSILLLIGQFDQRNRIECVYQKFNVTRLGEGVTQTGVLQQKAIKNPFRRLYSRSQGQFTF